MNVEMFVYGLESWDELYFNGLIILFGSLVSKYGVLPQKGK